jgi:membrane-bound lytic murein transglycosylase D
VKPGKPGSHGSGVSPADPAARRQIAGGPTADDVALGAETPELRALHDAERELFPPAMPALGAPWPDQLPSPLSATDGAPRVHATGLPPGPSPSSPPLAEGGKDLSWLAHLELPDIPVRWDARVVRYLEFYKDDPRGRQLFSFWLKRSGRYREAIRRSFRKKAMPEDLSWIAMVESGYEPTARSPAGAVGLWQFMPETAKLYGLPVDRWADQRMNVVAETDAAAEFLADLYRRFGAWELAVASYNMGYAGMMAIVRRYNNNDFWSLSRLEGALPWETTLYVPKLVAIAIVGKNLPTFGFADVVPDAAPDLEEIRVAPGTPLSTVAQAAGVPTKEIEGYNLELRAGRTPPAPVDAPPGDDSARYYPVQIPRGKGPVALASLAKMRGQTPALERYVVRFGETVDQIAATRHVTAARIAELNAIAPGEVVRGGTVLLLPKGPPVAAVASNEPASAAPAATKPVVIVPSDLFVYPDRRRVFYRVVVGDTVREVADAFHVTVDDLRRWNDLDPAARLLEGMTLQVFVPSNADLSRVSVLAENDAHVVSTGTQEFFEYWEGVKGKHRVVVAAKAGETIDVIGKRYGVSGASMERINRRGRSEALKEGESVVVYVPPPPGTVGVPAKQGAPSQGAFVDGRAAQVEPVPNGPLPLAPYPEGLPPLP